MKKVRDMNGSSQFNVRQFVGIGCVLFAVLFCFIVSARSMGNRPLVAGDTVWHYSNEIHLIRSIEQGQGIFSCFDKGAGIPALNFYQPLLYLLVALLYFASFKLLTVYFIHNLLICVLYALFPLSVFYCARSFRFTRLTAGIISLFTLFPISGWGHTISAYFLLGLDTQLVGALCFPTALGAVYRLNCSKHVGKNLTVLTLSVSGLILGHAVYAVLFAYTAPVYLTLFGIYRGWRQMRHLIKKLLFAGLLIVCITAFWAVPFMKFTGQYGFKSTVELTGSRLYSSFTPKHFFGALFTGELLDTPRHGNSLLATDNTAFRWPAAPLFNRCGIFTLFSLLGFLSLLRKRIRLRTAFFVTLFCWSIILLLGPDDVPFIRLLPFIDEFQCIRAIFLFELTCCFMAGILCSRLYTALLKYAQRKHGIHKTIPYTAAALLTIILCVPIAERYAFARSKLSAHPDERLHFIRQLYTAIPATASGRILYNEDTSALTSELSSFSDCVFRTSHLDNMLASSMMLGFNSIKRFITLSPYLLTLFDIGFVVTDTAWTPPKTVKNQYRLIERNRFFQLFAVPHQPSVFLSPQKKPVGVWCSDETWYFLNQLWLRWYTEKGTGMAHLLKLPHNLSSAPDPKLFSAVILFDTLPDSSQGTAYRHKLDTVHKATGKVLAVQSVNDSSLPGFDPHNSAQLLDVLSNGEKFPSPAVMKHDTANWYRYSADYTAAQPHLIIARKAYYHTWHAQVQDTNIPAYQVSPGFIGLVIPAGSGTFSIIYESSRIHLILFTSGMLLCAILIVLWRRSAMLRGNTAHDPQFYHLRFPAVCGRIVIVCGCVYLGGLCIAHIVFNTPSLVYPAAGAKQVNPTAKVFRWNEISADVAYDFQLAQDSRFATKIKTISSIKDTFLVYRALAPHQQYFWRVRIHSPEGKQRWSTPRAFVTGSY